MANSRIDNTSIEVCITVAKNNDAVFLRSEALRFRWSDDLFESF